MSNKTLLSTALATVFILLSLSTTAQQDERAEPYIDALAAEFSEDNCYLMEIEYIREDQMADTRIEGEATIVMKGEKYRMEADEFIVYFNGETLWSQNTYAEEVYVSTPDPAIPSYLQTVPVQIFKDYKKDFKYVFLGKLPYGDRLMAEVQLYPFELSGPYSMIKLVMDPDNYQLAGLQIKHKEGILYTLKINAKRHMEEEGGIFEFDPAKYPDTEIIELIQ